MTWRAWQLLVIAFVSAFAAAGLSMVYANRVAADSNRQWCEVIATIDDAYRIAPPATDISRKLARDIHALRQRFDC